MKYLMKGSVLYKNESLQPIAKIRGSFSGPQKKIVSPDGVQTAVADIRTFEPKERNTGDTGREYVLLNIDKKILMYARPDYDPEENPGSIGWPICRMPKVNRAELMINGISYFQTMKNSQSYVITSHSGEIVLWIFHRGLSGGWDIETEQDFSAEILCGLFIFGRYLERENELLIV